MNNKFQTSFCKILCNSFLLSVTFSSTLVLDEKLIHVVYSKLDRDVLVMAMPAEKYVFKVLLVFVIILKNI